MASSELRSCSSCSPSQRHRKDVRAAPVNFQPAPVQSLIPNAVLPPALACASVTLDTSRTRTSRAVSIQLAAYRCIALITVNCRCNYTSRDIYVFFMGDQKYPRFCGRSELSLTACAWRSFSVMDGLVILHAVATLRSPPPCLCLFVSLCVCLPSLSLSLCLSLCLSVSVCLSPCLSPPPRTLSFFLALCPHALPVLC